MTDEINELCQRLREEAAALDQNQTWPNEQLKWCADAGVFRWFIPEHYGGLGWNELQLLRGYLALSQACLTTTFVLTQWQAACKRILSSDNTPLKSRLLPSMGAGELFCTVGISHLTTSRQHLDRPVLLAEPNSEGGFRLNGLSPWVTGSTRADLIVIGATLAEGTQVLCAVPADRSGVHPEPSAKLVALTGSCTGAVRLENVVVAPEEVVAGPVDQVLQSGSGGGAGGLQTSTLAAGLSLAASEFLREQAARRPDLNAVADKMIADCQTLVTDLERLTLGQEPRLQAGDVRQRANSLVLRSTQAALTAAKGAGFLFDHPAGRWAREALFFLVWSCPQPVAAANLCEFAQLDS